MQGAEAKTERVKVEIPKQSRTYTEQTPKPDRERARKLFSAGNKAFEQRQVDRALHLYRKAYAIWPHPRILFNQAVSLGFLGRPLESARTFRKVLEYDPDHAAARLWLGKIAEAAGRRAEADMHYRKALELRPADPTMPLDVARHLLSRPEYKRQVKKMLDDCIAAYPHTAAFHVVLANFHLRHGNRTEAVKELREAYRLKPDLDWIPDKIKELESLPQPDSHGRTGPEKAAGSTEGR